jgi:YhcH/YjgK/YiaL family protein
MIHGELGDWRTHLSGEPWLTAFSFLAKEAASAPEGERIALNEGGMYALVMRYPTRGPEDAVLEAHDAHIDIQMSLEGNELIDWFPRHTLTPRAPYDAEKDVIFFERPGDAPARVNNTPGRITVLFPGDAHMAQLCGDAPPAPVKKVVVKVPVALLPPKE